MTCEVDSRPTGASRDFTRFKLIQDAPDLASKLAEVDLDRDQSIKIFNFFHAVRQSIPRLQFLEDGWLSIGGVQLELRILQRIRRLFPTASPDRDPAPSPRIEAILSGQGKEVVS
jgi:hypothetical protein